MDTPNKNTRIHPIYFVIMFILLLVYWWAGKYFFPPPPEPPKREGEAAKVDKDKDKDKEKPPAAGAGRAAEPVAPKDRELVTLGAPGSHLTVKLDPWGAGVRQVLLNHFQAANPKTGEPEWEDPGHKKKKPLELVPEDKNSEIGSFLLYHYDKPKDEDFPLDTLGKRLWERVEPEGAKEGDEERVAFQTEVQGVRITKTYSLRPRDYHVGLGVRLELVDPQAKERVFRYQLTGAHGLPIEGQWYTGVFRNALIGRVNEKENAERVLQDLREISLKDGGDEVARDGMSIRYAGVGVQFFASVIAVETKDQEHKDFLGHARAVPIELATKGTVPKDSDNADEVVVESAGKKYTFEYARPEDKERFKERLTGDVIVVHRAVIERSGKRHDVITDVLDANETAPDFHNDMTVAVSTRKDDKILTLKPGPENAVVHKYTLYNGPVKVRLLKHLTLDEAASGHEAGDDAVDAALVDHYLDDLHLNTLTDYPTSGMGRAFEYVHLTTVVIWFTNRMHDILWLIYRVVHYVTPDFLVYGVCILLLTVLVRGAMHPVSRKQARTTMKMQALQPELAKLKEKYKDDRQALGMAQMELYRKHGINPMGSCWLMLLQMPVFLGLYYCLQESIHFRLAPFLWIKSLTAPDMLIHWGDQIWVISKWDNYGAGFPLGMLYLGPYFNLLPVIAVVLMIFQQKLTMPPPADEQGEMQHKMMKYMMIFFGLMFYKVAAGLCLYFIASSLWGFAERKLLPKKKADGTAPAPTAPARPTLVQRLMQRLLEAQRRQTGANGAAPAPPPPAGGGKKKRGRGAPAGGAPARDGLLAKVRAWWAEVLRQAEKR